MFFPVLLNIMCMFCCRHCHEYTVFDATDFLKTHHILNFSIERIYLTMHTLKHKQKGNIHKICIYLPIKTHIAEARSEFAAVSPSTSLRFPVTQVLQKEKHTLTHYFVFIVLTLLKKLDIMTFLNV